MRIALLAPLRFPIAEPFHGGLEMHTHLLAKGLVAAGHEVTLFAHPDSDFIGQLTACSMPAEAGLLGQTLAYRKAMLAIRRGNFDAVHNNSIHWLPPLLAGGLRCPVVTTLHTPPYRTLRWAGRFSRAANHTFVSISQHLHDDWAAYVGPHKVVHNGIDVARWPLGTAPVPGTAVWYGRFTPEKGAEYAIAAAREAGYSLTLAGPVYDQAYFDEKIAPELDSQITYAGHLRQEELAAVVGKAAVGIVTSVWDEPFGLVYVEIPACGTPVAAFASGAAAEIVIPATGAIVPKYDTGALAQVLGTLTGGDRAERRLAVRERFGVRRMIERYEALYER